MFSDTLLIGIKCSFFVIVFYEPTDITIARRPFTTESWQSIKFITPNLGELRQIASHLKIGTSGIFANELEEASHIAQNLADLIENVIVTLGPNGILIARKAKATDPFFRGNKTGGKASVRHYAVEEKSDFVNVSGAGDCFASGFAVALLEGLPETRCVSVGFAAALTALYSQSPVPNKMFDKYHKSWQTEAEFKTIR